MSAEPDAAAEYDWLTLEEGEDVVWSSVPHRYSLVPALLLGIPLSIVLVGIPIVVGAYLWRENTVYVVTTQALYAKSGILSRDVQRIDFGKVQNISYSQDVFGTQFGYGDVDVSTAGSSGVEMQFASIPDPKAVADRIKSRVRDDGGDRDDNAAAVLDEILGELQAIRQAVEGGDGRGSVPSRPTTGSVTAPEDDPE